MRVAFRSFAVFALTSAIAGCSSETPVAKTAAKSESAPKASADPAKPSTALANLGQVVLEVPGMT